MDLIDKRLYLGYFADSLCVGSLNQIVSLLFTRNFDKYT